jgi:hypothetical protein
MTYYCYYDTTSPGKNPCNLSGKKLIFTFSKHMQKSALKCEGGFLRKELIFFRFLDFVKPGQYLRVGRISAALFG